MHDRRAQEKGRRVMAENWVERDALTVADIEASMKALDNNEPRGPIWLIDTPERLARVWKLTPDEIATASEPGGYVVHGGSLGYRTIRAIEE